MTTKHDGYIRRLVLKYDDIICPDIEWHDELTLRAHTARNEIKEHC